MKEHDWQVEEIDGGPIGVGRFWKCAQCGASGGPVIFKRNWRPFLAGPGLKLSEDCSIAAEEIRQFRATIAQFPGLLAAYTNNGKDTERIYALAKKFGQRVGSFRRWSRGIELEGSFAPYESLRKEVVLFLLDQGVRL